MEVSGSPVSAFRPSCSKSFSGDGHGSAPSERVFSSGGSIVTKNRASMRADTVADLILLKESLSAAKAFELKKSQNMAKR